MKPAQRIMTMKTLFKSVALLALIAVASFGQNVLVTNTPLYAPLVGSTSLSGAVAATDVQVCVASPTGIVLPSLSGSTAGSLLFIDTEAMQVTSQGVSSSCFRVKRGQLGSPSIVHATAVVVWIGNSSTSSGDTSRPFNSNLFALEDAAQGASAPTATPFPYGAITSTAPVSGTTFFSQITVQYNRAVTGACVLNGTTASTDQHLVALYDYSGKLVANSAVAGFLASGASLLQCAAFLTPVELSGPATYYLAVQSNGTTGLFGLYVTGNVGPSYVTGSVTGTFGTIKPTIAPGNAFTTAKGPIGTLY
jgi:hypothetical protein